MTVTTSDAGSPPFRVLHVDDAEFRELASPFLASERPLLDVTASPSSPPW